MIAFPDLGKYGRLGNQLFQLAALMAFSKKYNCEFAIPPWEYAKYFDYKFNRQNFETDILIEEPFFHYTPEFWDAHATDFREKQTGIKGYFQTEKYWKEYEDDIMQMFSFSPKLVENIRKKHAEIFSKPSIAIHIRRTDFVNHPNFYQLPLEYFIGALLQFFPDYKNNHIVFFSDDIYHCKLNIKKLPCFYFIEGQSNIEDLCMMSLCDHYIISNSTFSWWGAVLGEKKHSVIVRPAYYLAGEFQKKMDWRDFYPDRWRIYDHADKQIDISSFHPPLLQKKKVSISLKLQSLKNHFKL